MHRHLVRTLLILAAMLLLAAAMYAQTSQVSAKTKALSIKVTHTELASYSHDGLQFRVTLTLKASRNLTLDGVTFSQVRANGIPLYLSNINGRQELKAGEEFTPPPLLLTMHLRDMEDMSPLRQIVSEGMLHLTGSAYAEVELSPLTRLLLLSQKLRVAMPFDKMVPMKLPGGGLGKLALLTLIANTQARIDRDGDERKEARILLERQNTVWQQYAHRILLIRSRCLLATSNGATQEYVSSSAALRLDGRLFLLPWQSVEPWKFDPSLALSIKQQHLKIIDFDLMAWPLDAEVLDAQGEPLTSTAWTLSRNQLHLLESSNGETKGVYVLGKKGARKKVNLARPTGAQALALAEITEPEVQPLAPPAYDVSQTPGAAQPPSSTAPGSPSTAPALLYFFRFPAGSDTVQATPELQHIPRPANGELTSGETAIDFSAAGSPLISERGIAGIILDEHTVVPIREVIEKLKIPVSRN